MSFSRAPGLVDRVFANHAGRRGFNSHWRHMSRTNFPIKSTRISAPSVLWAEKGGIRLAVDDCAQCHWLSAVALAWSKRQNCTCACKTQDSRTVPGVRGHGSLPLSYSGNVITRNGIYLQCHFISCSPSANTFSQPIKSSQLLILLH